MARASWPALLLCLSVAAYQAGDPSLVLRFDVDLVQVDAIVTDPQGRHVPGLTKDDFQVLQDGKPQRITHFSYVPGDEAGDRHLAPSGASQPSRQEVRRAVAIVVDECDLKVTDFLYLQQALSRFVDQSIQPGDLVALIRTSGGSGALQQFTGNRDLLRQAVRHLTWKPSLPLADRLLKPVLIAAAQAMAPYPGRKSIVVISPGRVIDAGLVAGELLQDLHEITDAANRASVAIDAIDIRGLAVLMPGVADDFDSGGRGGARRGGAQLGRLMRTYRASQTYLEMLAESTGGLFQRDNNDLTGQVKNAVEDAGGYYLLAWSPGASAFQHKPGADIPYHDLEVKLLRKSLTVRSRQGFFAVPGGTRAEPVLSAEQQAREALFSPFRSGGIDVQLTPMVAYDSTGAATIESHLRIQPSGVVFRTEPDGCRTAGLELLATAVSLDPSASGKEKISGDHVSVTVCGDTARDVMRDGLVAVLRNPVAPGHYQVRAAVRNNTPEAGPIGSAAQTIEVPDPHKQPVVIEDITLWTGGAAPKLISGTSYRMVEQGDPAVRRFHPNDAVKFAFRVLGSAAQAQVKLLRGEKEVYAAPARAVQSGELVTGLYRLDAAATPGQYLFGVVVTAGGREYTQWLDLEVVAN